VTREHPNFAGTRYLDSYSGQRLEFVLREVPEPRMVKPFEHHPVYFSYIQLYTCKLFP
jgi:hypothetical protein